MDKETRYLTKEEETQAYMDLGVSKEVSEKIYNIAHRKVLRTPCSETITITDDTGDESTWSRYLIVEYDQPVPVIGDKSVSEHIKIYATVEDMRHGIIRLYEDSGLSITREVYNVLSDLIDRFTNNVINPMVFTKMRDFALTRLNQLVERRETEIFNVQ